MSFVRQSLTDQTFQGAPLKKSTCHIHKWIGFCNKKALEIFTTDVASVLSFVTMLFNDGLAYSAINTARSALSAFVGVSADTHIGSHTLIIRFMKGVSRNRPTLPRYNDIWDVK